MPILTEIATTLMTERYGIDAGFARARYLETAGADFATQLEEIFPSHASNADVAAEFEQRQERALRGARPFDDAMPTLQLLRTKSVRQFVCSSTRDELVGAALERTALIACLDGWVGHRPGFDKALQIASVVREHGLDPATTLFIGGSPRDAEYARGGGVSFRGLGRGGDTVQFALLGVATAADLRSFVRAWDRAGRAHRAARNGGAAADSAGERAGRDPARDHAPWAVSDPGQRKGEPPDPRGSQEPRAPLHRAGTRE